MAKGTGLTGFTNVRMDLRHLNEVDINIVLDELKIDTGIVWTYGVGANQANVLFHTKRTIAQAQSETLDLYASGSLVDAFGNALTMEAIKLLYVRNTSASLIVTAFGGASLDLLIMNGTTNGLVIHPGGQLLWTCPTAAGIVTSTNKNLKLAVGAGAGSAIIEVVALGLD